MSKTWMDGKPFTVTAEQLSLKWGLRRDPRLRCALCGHVAEVGEVFRWQYTNDVPGAWGNPMVCTSCDGTKAKIVKVIKSRYHDMQTTHYHFK